VTQQELLTEATDIKTAIETLERQLKMEYMTWDDRIRTSPLDLNVQAWRDKAEQARQRLGREPNERTEALCRMIEREQLLLPGEIEQRNNHATNEGFTGSQWAHYLVFGCR
jgi:hypothetical protein